MKPADLAVHNCLHFTKTDSATRGTRPLGKGQARLPEVLVHEPLNRNQLVTVLDDYAPPAIPLHLTHVGGRHLPPRTRAFLDFMVPRITRLSDGLGPHDETRSREYSKFEPR
jgi:hypothetical protein